MCCTCSRGEPELQCSFRVPHGCGEYHGLAGELVVRKRKGNSGWRLAAFSCPKKKGGERSEEGEEQDGTLEKVEKEKGETGARHGSEEQEGQGE